MVLGDHVAEIDADAEPYPPLLAHLRLAIVHPTLDIHRASHCVHHTGKFGQQPVAGVLHGTASVFRDLRLYKLAEMGLEPLMRPLLIRAHQTRIPRHIGG